MNVSQKYPHRNLKTRINVGNHRDSSLVSNWRGRRTSGKGYTLSLNTLYDTRELSMVLKGVLGVIVSHAHNDTNGVLLGPARLSEWTGKSYAQCRRYLKTLTELGYLVRTTDYDEDTKVWGETFYQVNLRPTFPAKEIHKPVDFPVKNDLTPPVINDPTLNSIKYYELKTEPQAPLAGGVVCESPKPLDPSQIKPQLPEAPARRHHEHNHPAKTPQPCRAALNAFQIAAVEVMRLCGVVETNWRTRDGIAAAIALRVDGCVAMARRCG